MTRPRACLQPFPCRHHRTMDDVMLEEFLDAIDEGLAVPRAARQAGITVDQGNAVLEYMRDLVP